MESRIARLNRIAPRHIRARAALWVTELHGPERDGDPRGSGETLDSRRIHGTPPPFELATEAWQKSGNLPAHLPPRTGSSPNRTGRVPRPGAGHPRRADRRAGRGDLSGTRRHIDDRIRGAKDRRAHRWHAGIAQRQQQGAGSIRRPRAQGDLGRRRGAVHGHQTPIATLCGGHRGPQGHRPGDLVLVRREEPAGSAFAITLVEGRVAVEPISWPDALPSNPAAGAKLLNPGQRLRFQGDKAETVDSPRSTR